LGHGINGDTRVSAMMIVGLPSKDPDLSSLDAGGVKGCGNGREERKNFMSFG